MDVKTTCLGILSAGDATGYEIRKAFAQGPFAHFAGGSYGSIYPALTKAEKEGLVICQKQAQEKRPAKKIYTITSKGRIHLIESLMADPGEDKFRSNFLFTLYFADDLPARRIEQIIDQRLADYQEKINHLTCIGARGHPAQQKSPDIIREMGVAYYTAMKEIVAHTRHKFVAAALRGKNKSNAKTQIAE